MAFPRRDDLSVRYSEGDAALRADLLAVAAALVPGFLTPDTQEADAIQVVTVQGGITNLLYRLDPPKGSGKDSVLVRVYGAKTELLIDREREMRLLDQLGKLGFSPRFYGAFSGGRLEGWRWMRPLKNDELGREDVRPAIARQLARLHGFAIEDDQNPTRAASLWSVVQTWLDIVRAVSFEEGSDKARLFARIDVPSLVAERDWLTTVLPSDRNGNGQALLPAAAGGVGGSPVRRRAAEFAFASVFSHNDLLAGNILRDDASGDLQVIDFEYGAYNYRAFDFANHFDEYSGFDCKWDLGHPSDADAKAFLAAYVAASGQPPLQGEEQEEFLDELLKWTARFCLASHLFWGFWGIVQAKYSPIDFDFLDYARQRFVGYYYLKGRYARHFWQH